MTRALPFLLSTFCFLLCAAAQNVETLNYTGPKAQTATLLHIGANGTVSLAVTQPSQVLIVPPVVYGPFQKPKAEKVAKAITPTEFEWRLRPDDARNSSNYVGIWVIETSTNFTNWTEVGQICEPRFTFPVQKTGTRFWRARSYAEAYDTHTQRTIAEGDAWRLLNWKVTKNLEIIP